MSLLAPHCDAVACYRGDSGDRSTTRSCCGVCSRTHLPVVHVFFRRAPRRLCARLKPPLVIQALPHFRILTHFHVFLFTYIDTILILVNNISYTNLTDKVLHRHFVTFANYKLAFQAHCIASFLDFKRIKRNCVNKIAIRKACSPMELLPHHTVNLVISIRISWPRVPDRLRYYHLSGTRVSSNANPKLLCFAHDVMLRASSRLRVQQSPVVRTSTKLVITRCFCSGAKHCWETDAILLQNMSNDTRVHIKTKKWPIIQLTIALRKARILSCDICQQKRLRKYWLRNYSKCCLGASLAG